MGQLDSRQRSLAFLRWRELIGTCTSAVRTSRIPVKNRGAPSARPLGFYGRRAAGAQIGTYRYLFSCLNMYRVLIVVLLPQTHGASLDHLGASLDHLGASLDHLGAIMAHLVVSWALFGIILDHLGAIWGPSWAGL